MKDINWINSVRALCMVIIYWRHVECYLGVVPFHPESTGFFYVNAFFVVSGYLYFKKLSDSDGGYKFSAQLTDILFKLVLPVIFFSAILIIPKYVMFRHQEVSYRAICYDIFGGVASWFVAALIVAKLILSVISKCARVVSIYIYTICGIFTAWAGCWLSGIDPTPFPWFYKSGMIAVLFMAYGGILYYAKILENRKKSVGMFVFSILSLILIGTMIKKPICTLMSASCDLPGIVIAVSACYGIIFVASYLPKNIISDFIGRNSIVYYFFCNAIPAAVSVGVIRLFKIGGTWYTVWFVTIISLLISSGLVYLIRNFMPFLLDIRKIPVLAAKK